MCMPERQAEGAALPCCRFSVTMGVGIVSLLLYTAPHKFRHMDDIGVALYLASLALWLHIELIEICMIWLACGADC